MTDPKPQVPLEDVAEEWTATGQFDITNEWDSIAADDTAADVFDHDGEKAEPNKSTLGPNDQLKGGN